MTKMAPTGPSLRPTPRFAGQAKATPSGRGRLLWIRLFVLHCIPKGVELGRAFAVRRHKPASFGRCVLGVIDDRLRGRRFSVLRDPIERAADVVAQFLGRGLRGARTLRGRGSQPTLNSGATCFAVVLQVF
jgi:hypothetical protein